MFPFVLQVNILVKGDGSACLADFGLMSIALDPETTDITTTEGTTKGTYRWMSPELFFPAEFGLSKFQLTKESDCYAFGMVIYEVIDSQCGAQLPLLVSSVWRRFSRGISPSKKSNPSGRCRAQSSEGPARLFQKLFLREWWSFGKSRKNVGPRTLGIDRASQQFLASLTRLHPWRTLPLLHYANPNRCRL